MSDLHNDTDLTVERAVQHDAISGATILVGEMIATSDLAHLSVPQAAGQIVQKLVETRAPRRILLAGPRAGLLLPVIPTDRSVDVLTRSLPDIRDLSVLGGLHTHISHYCGSFTDFKPNRSYDLVIALGGPQRLISPDCVGMTTQETINRLGDLTADGGVLVTDLANELGLTDLVSAVPDPQLAEDTSWWVGADGFSPRAAYARERDSLLRDAGFRPGKSYAALPDLDGYNLLIADTLATDPARAGRVQSIAAQATNADLADLPMLRDVHQMLGRVTGAGLLDELSPAWLLIAEKTTGDEEPAWAEDLHEVVQVETGLDDWSQMLAIGSTGSVSRTWVDGATDAERTEGRLSRTLAAAATEGDSLDDSLRAACARRQHSEIRALVRRYAAWLGDQKTWAGQQVSHRFFAIPRNVVVTDDGLALVDSTWSLALSVSPGDSLLHGLRDFAINLLASGGAHPWRIGVTPDELAVTLAAMAGFSVTPSDIVRVNTIRCQIEADIKGSPEIDPEELEAHLERGRHARDLPAPNEVGYRELLTQYRSLAREMREKDGQIVWLEGTLRLRDRYVRRLEKTIERYEETLTYRTVEVLRSPRRIATSKAVSLAKSTADEVLPPGAVSRARGLATRLLK